ncbi:MAG: ImmA/IrrE family metallo-endopeptidase [Candidatus Aminicenantes bacterium]|nr:ImmA/IrrE family metallo-endopeptidase [Candidatus Aminicenantes bacterium]
MPVPIIDVVELKLRISPIPVFGLLEEIDIDGFLTKDLSSICIDKDVYENPRKENRLRFTFAHEIGHLVLHQKEIQLCRFRTPSTWIRFRDDFEEDDLYWFEQQAYEFAGRLLVPRQKLIQEIGLLAPQIEDFRRRGGSESEQIVQAISRSICKIFVVSADVIARRIKSEKLKI